MILWYSLTICGNFASKCGKVAAQLIEPGDGDRPEQDWCENGTTPLHEPCALKFLGVSVHELACTKSCHSLWCPVQESKWAACWRCLKTDLIFDNFDIISKRNPYPSSYNRDSQAEQQPASNSFRQPASATLDSSILCNLFFLAICFNFPKTGWKNM